MDAYRKDITQLKGFVDYIFKKEAYLFFKKKSTFVSKNQRKKAERSQLQSQRQKLMNKGNVISRLGISSNEKLSPGISSG